MDSKKGMEYLIENNLVENNPDAVGSFLYNGEGLNKTSIGEYLGEKNDFNIKVLKNFVYLHEFKNKNLVEALRDFLWNFRLPGEAQKNRPHDGHILTAVLRLQQQHFLGRRGLLRHLVRHNHA